MTGFAANSLLGRGLGFVAGSWPIDLATVGELTGIVDVRIGLIAGDGRGDQLEQVIGRRLKTHKLGLARDRLRGALVSRPTELNLDFLFSDRVWQRAPIDGGGSWNGFHEGQRMIRRASAAIGKYNEHPCNFRAESNHESAF